MSNEPMQDTSTSRSAQSQPVYVIGTPDHESGIDLIALIRIIWAGKWLIIAITTLFIAAGVAYTIFATPVYHAESVLIANKPEQGSSLASSLGSLSSLAGINLGIPTGTTDALAVLRSRVFVEDFIRENDLLPVLFDEQWDAANARWIDDDPDEWPDIQDGVKYFIDNVLTIDEDPSTGLVTLAVEWSDPILAAKWVEDMVVKINERLRSRDLSTSERRLEYLNDQLSRANLVELRQAMSRLIETEVQTMTLARAETEYAFRVIDPPRVPNEIVYPKRISVLLLSFLLGGVIGTSIVLLRDSLGDDGSNASPHAQE
jgi:uncharacterized protein involved in exopolysaccharide biosynthesis